MKNKRNVTDEGEVVDKLVVKYDGEALKNHKIDLDVLTESLNGLNNLCNTKPNTIFRYFKHHRNRRNWRSRSWKYFN